MKRPVVIGLLVIALLFVLAGIGAVVFFAVNNGFSGNNPFDRNNIASIVEESKSLKVDAKKQVTLTVANDAGDVSIVGGDVDKVEVKAIMTAYDSTQARADEEVKTIRYSIEQSGNTITLKYELPKSMNFNNNINTVDFVVTVPTETVVDVNTNSGEVSVQDIKGSAQLENDFGDVTVKNLQGKLNIQSNGGTIEAQAVDAGSKDVKIDSDFGAITLEKIKARNVHVVSNSGAVTFSDVRASGDAYIESDFGDTTFENGSADSLEFKTSSGKVVITKANISKELKVQNDFGEIELDQAMAGSYDLHTNSGAITIDGAQGDLKASTDFGNIEVSNAVEVNLNLETNSGTIKFSGSLGKGPHNVVSDFGNITLALPADSNLDIDLTTDVGNISSDIPITIKLSGDLDKGHQIGTMNEGGGSLTVQTNNGNIEITAIK